MYFFDLSLQVFTSSNLIPSFFPWSLPSTSMLISQVINSDSLATWPMCCPWNTQTLILIWAFSLLIAALNFMCSISVEMGSPGPPYLTLFYGTAVSPELQLSLQPRLSPLLIGVVAAGCCCYPFSAQAISNSEWRHSGGHLNWCGANTQLLNQSPDYKSCEVG